MNEKIEPHELLKIAGPDRGDKIQLFTRENTLVIEDTYDKSENPFGDQIIWTVYSNEKRGMDKFKEDLDSFFSELEKKAIVFYEHTNPEKDLFPRIHVLSDGRIKFQANEVEVYGEKGYVGAVVGQGRELTSQAFDILVFLLGRFAYQRHLKQMEKEFFENCKRKMEEISERLGIELKEEEV